MGLSLKVRLEGMDSFDGWLLLGEATLEEFLVVAGLGKVVQAKWGDVSISAPGGGLYRMWIGLGGRVWLERDASKFADVIRENL